MDRIKVNNITTVLVIIIIVLAIISANLFIKLQLNNRSKIDITGHGFTDVDYYTEVTSTGELWIYSPSENSIEYFIYDEENEVIKRVVKKIVE